MQKNILLGLLFCLSACGPIYNTDYQFSPPSSSGGRACVFQCEQGRMQCRQIEELQASRCQDHARYEQQRCRDDLRYNENRSPKWYECSAESCAENYDRCEDIYRACYQSCGGEVRATTRCVANCDQARKSF